MLLQEELNHQNREMLEKATGKLRWKLEKASCQVNSYREIFGTKFKSVFAEKKWEPESKPINRVQAECMSSRSLAFDDEQRQLNTVNVDCESAIHHVFILQTHC